MSKKRAGAFAEKKRENQILNNIAEFQKKITGPSSKNNLKLYGFVHII